MNDERYSDQQLQAMIRDLPEREIPVGMPERIMKEISLLKKGLGQRILQFLISSVTLNLQPLRLAGSVCALAVVFWLGLTIGGHRDVRYDDAREISRSLKIASTNAEANFLIGRGLLTVGQWNEAVPFLQQASTLVPENPEYALWEGVALGKSGNTEDEREIYRKTIGLHPEYVPARLYLGHTLLENGHPEAALAEYNRVLALTPDTETALYNRALAYQLLGQKELEAAAWKEYLMFYRKGTWAYRAVDHLNDLGDFTFRNYQIGYRGIIFNQELLLGPDSADRQREIELLAYSFREASGNVLNIIVFQANEPPLAAMQARNLKHFVNGYLAESANKKVDISWFGQPEQILSESGKQFPVQESLLIFSKPNVQKTEEKTI